MVIFSLFSMFCLLIITIRFVVILKNRQSGEEKYQSLLGLFFALLLVSFSWGVIYAFFGYDTSGNVVGKAPQEELEKKTNKSIVKFKEKEHKKNGD